MPNLKARMGRYRIVSIIAATAVIAGCSGFLESDEPAASTWWLEPADIAADAIAGPVSHLALDVSVVPGLDTDLILTLDDDARLNHFAGAHWADSLPELVTSIVARSLDDTERFDRVSIRDYAKPGECLLSIEFRAFYARLDGAGQAREADVALAGLFRCDDETKRLQVQARAPIASHRLPAIVAAFQAATDDALVRLAGQLSTVTSR